MSVSESKSTRRVKTAALRVIGSTGSPIDRLVAPGSVSGGNQTCVVPTDDNDGSGGREHQEIQ